MVSKTCLCIIGFVVGAVVLGTAIGLIVHFTTGSSDDDGPWANCYPEGGETEQLCKNRGCKWQPSTEDGGFQCVYPDDAGYEMTGNQEDTVLGYSVTLKRRSEHKSPFGGDIENLRVDVEYHTDSMLRVKIYDKDNVRYEVPKEAVDIQGGTSAAPEEARLYTVEHVEKPFGFKVKRKSSGAVIFDSTVPGMVFSDQYLQITTRLPSSNVYGFGEHNHRQFKHNMNFKRWSIFTRDVAPVDEWNLYGAQPYYMNVEEDGSANGVLLLNSNAMDIMLQPDPYPGISYHVIGGVLDFYFFLGPSPENVVQQYTQATGRPLMPPYWSLGFQLSRWDYSNLSHVETVVDRNLQANIPLDVMYGDIDYMLEKLDFTYDDITYAGLPEFVDKLHEQGMRYIIILDHCIGSDESKWVDRIGDYRPYKEGLERDIFIRRENGDILEGEVWPGLVHYPDFTNLSHTGAWWTEQCIDFYNGTDWGVQYDALWIDMNEPSNFVAGSTSGCPSNNWNEPPYIPNILGGESGNLYDKTICMDTVQAWGSHYDVHNLYGHSMSITSWNTLRDMFPDKRPFVLTRSQFTGTQKYAAHWLGDNQSIWEQIPWSIVGMMEYSLFGFSYTGSDICGFWFATTEEMCQRWMQLGAFYPYSRNHNGETWPDQDPGNFGQEMIESSKKALNIRYKLLPFLYTLMYDAHTKGSTVVRPLLHEYPTDPEALSIDKQFLWGPSLLISAAMEEGQRYVNTYVPNDRWFDYYTYKEVENVGSWNNLSTPLDHINLHIRGGHIIPWQYSANNTFYSRLNSMGLIVALGSARDSYASEGHLFWDDGESFETHTKPEDHRLLNFKCSQDGSSFVLTTSVDGSYTTALGFEAIHVLGLPARPRDIVVNDSKLDATDYEYDTTNKVLFIRNQNLPITDEHTITWVNDF